jgi:hypothetical protein
VAMKNAKFWDVTPYGSCENDVSEERIASFIRVTRIDELGIALAVTSNRSTLRRNVIPSLPILVTLMTEALRSSEASVLTTATRR